MSVHDNPNPNTGNTPEAKGTIFPGAFIVFLVLGVLAVAGIGALVMMD